MLVVVITAVFRFAVVVDLDLVCVCGWWLCLGAFGGVRFVLRIYCYGCCYVVIMF